MADDEDVRSEDTARGLRWERVPLLGDNPVFCFEARRLWVWRTTRIVILILVGVGLVSWAIRPLLFTGATGGSVPEMRWALMRLLGGAIPPAVPPLEGFLATPKRPEVLADYVWRPHLLMQILDWVVTAAGRYLVPALAAVSMASDRASRRLEPLLATRMSLRQILVGKLMASVLPFLVLLLAAAVLFGPWAVKAGHGTAEGVVTDAMYGVLGLLVGAMVGLRVGASARHPAVAVGVALFIVLMGLPLLWWGVAAIAWQPMYEAMGSPAGPKGWWWWYYLTGVWVAVDGLILAGLWFSTKRALARIAE